MRHSPVRRDVFLHNPKAAGTSLGVWLQDQHGYQHAVSDLDAPVDPAIPDGLIWLHNWRVPESLADCRVWCVVREPLARWGSFWNYTRRRHPAAAAMGFDQFTRECLGWLPTQLTYVARCGVWIRLESLAEGLETLGFDQIQKLGRENTTGDPVPWTARTRAIVREHFRADFEALGY